MIYLDTSAYLTVLFEETGSKQIEKILHNKKLFSSSFMFLEAERNIIHYGRQKRISTNLFEEAIERIRSDVEGFQVKELSHDQLFTRIFPAIRTPKSADLVHLRTAVWFLNNGGLELFVTADDHQRQSARELGIPV